jgi:hypothetical protein
MDLESLAVEKCMLGLDLFVHITKKLFVVVVPGLAQYG